MEWLLESIDPNRLHTIEPVIAWHGRAMALAWGVLTPLAILLARYFKVLPKQHWPQELDNQFWWVGHRALQYLAAVLMAVATVMILYRSLEFLTNTWHQQVGWTVLSLTVIQILSGIFRGTKGGPSEPAPDGSWHGDHYDMTPHRVLFEYYHKILGYLLLAGAVYCILSGMWMVNAPCWMWLGLGLWWSLLIVASIVLQYCGGCFDTYKAIWGNSLRLPGNRRSPIGFGINNYLPWRKTKNH